MKQGRIQWSCFYTPPLDGKNFLHIANNGNFSPVVLKALEMLIRRHGYALDFFVYSIKTLKIQLDIGELRNNKVKIRELIAFEELPADFCVMVEVFALRLGKRWDHKWQSVWDLAARTFR